MEIRFERVGAIRISNHGANLPMKERKGRIRRVLDNICIEKVQEQDGLLGGKVGEESERNLKITANIQICTLYS